MKRGRNVSDNVMCYITGVLGNEFKPYGGTSSKVKRRNIIPRRIEVNVWIPYDTKSELSMMAKEGLLLDVRSINVASKLNDVTRLKLIRGLRIDDNDAFTAGDFHGS